MFLPRIPALSCTAAWLTASLEVNGQPGHESHQVVIDVDDPLAESDEDRAVIAELDAYLEGRKEPRFPVATVANTIFPQSIFDRYGTPDFYDVYLEKVFPRLKRSSRDWGRYFERMTAHPSLNGKPVNNLELLVTKMKRHVASGRPFRNIYELPIYDPLRDAGGSPRGGQCLSYLSFKLTEQHQLLLCAVYRNHYYTEKLLGNLVGLGRLMKFVADEAKIDMGKLTIVSTHAEVDVAGGSREEINGLHSRCEQILASTAA